MYAMTGKLTAQPDVRSKLVVILKRAAELVGRLPGCFMYIVSEDLSNPTTVWVFEMWADKQAHDSSLQDERVRALIAEARPLLHGPPDGAELHVAGGHGIPIS